MDPDQEVLRWAVQSVSDLGLRVIGISENLNGATILQIEIPPPRH